MLYINLKVYITFRLLTIYYEYVRQILKYLTSFLIRIQSYIRNNDNPEPEYYFYDKSLLWTNREMLCKALRLLEPKSS